MTSRRSRWCAPAAVRDDATGAMTRAVQVLKLRIPSYAWVGIYLLDGRRAGARPVPRQAVAPHADSARPRHLRRAATEKRTIVVDDVNADPRYLACSIETKSEIVVPIMHGSRPRRDRHRQRRPAAFGPADRTCWKPSRRCSRPD